MLKMKPGADKKKTNLFHCFFIAIKYVNKFIFIGIYKNDEDGTNLGEYFGSGREIRK